MKFALIAGLIAVLPIAAQTPNPVVLRSDVDRLQTALEQLGTTLGTVKNAPYSAEATTTTTQTLSDGNRIEQSTSQKLYRDSQGRERREESMLAIGAVTQPNPGVTVTISDPMERVSYTLNPQTRTAQRTPGMRALAAGSGILIPHIYNGENKSFYFSAYTNYAGSAAAADLAAARKPVVNPNMVKEDLGSQTIEGVMAQGTRTTETIPAGEIGNLLPINVVDEVWYSPELKMNLLTTHSDPRSGQVIYRLTNINRSEQPRSLFEPPADYTITGPAAGGGGRGPAPEHPITK